MGVQLIVTCAKEATKVQLAWRQLDRDRTFVERYALTVESGDTGFAIR